MDKQNDVDFEERGIQCVCYRICLLNKIYTNSGRLCYHLLYDIDGFFPNEITRNTRNLRADGKKPKIRLFI